METLTLTNFAGLNTKLPIEELSINPVESPNIINMIMEEGTIFSRAGQNTFYNFNTLDKINSLYLGKLGNNDVNIAQVGTTIKKQGGGSNIDFKWWNDKWKYCRKITIVNSTMTEYFGLLLNLHLPAGFDYTNFRDNGEDIRFIPYIGAEFDVSNYPNGLDYEIRLWGKSATQTALSADINATTTTIPVISTTGYSNEGVIVIENERINYGGITTTSFTNCIRGYEGTSATTHPNGTIVRFEGCIYVKIPEIKAQSSYLVYMYYGYTGVLTNEQLRKSDQKGVATIWKIFDNNNELNDIRYFDYDANTHIGYIQDGKLFIREVSKHSGSTGYFAAYIYKPINNIPVEFESKVDAIEGGHNHGIGFYFEKGSGSSYEYGYIRLKWTYVPTRLILEGHHYPPSFGEYQEQVSDAYISEELIYSLYYNPSSRLVRGKVKRLNGQVIFNKSFIFSQSILNNYDRLSWLGFTSYINGLEITVDDVKAFEFLPNSVSSSLGTEITKPSGSDIVDWIDLYPNVDYTSVSTKPHQIIAFLKNYIFVNEDIEAIMWDGTTTKKVGGGGKRAKLGLMHKNRLWLFNFPGINQPTMVWYSNINKIELNTDWQTLGINNVEFINADDGFEITAVGLMSDSITIHKGNGVWLWYGDIPNHAIKKLNIDVGCIAQKTIAEWENGQFFISKKGIHFLRGSVAETPIIFTVDNIQSDNLAEKIMPLFMEINHNYIKDAIGVVWNDRYFVALPYQSSEVNNILLILDYRRGWISKWIPPEPITSMFIYPVTNDLYIGTAKGKIRLQGKRSYTYDDILKDDDIIIQNRYDTGKMDLGIPNIRKRLRFIEPLFSGQISLDLDVDGQIISLGTFTNGLKLSKKKIPLLKVGQFFQLGISNLTKQLHSITLYYNYLRT